MADTEEAVERVSTGIPGLDELIEGGLVEGSVTLVSGGAGTGKTLFCSQFLWHGLQNDENCLFITLEEEPDEIKRDAQEFGWDFASYEDDDQFAITYMNPFKGSSTFGDHVRTKIKEVDADRVALDSTSIMGMHETNTGDIRQGLYELVRKLRSEGVTTVLTAEIPNQNEEQLSRYGVEEFVADGVIRLEYISIGRDAFGQLEVLKMRRTDISKGKHETHIDENGLSIGEETLDIK